MPKQELESRPTDGRQTERDGFVHATLLQQQRAIKTMFTKYGYTRTCQEQFCFKLTSVLYRRP